MPELDLSIMASSADPAAEIEPVLDEFEIRHGVHVNLQIMPWSTAWSDLVKMALYQHGPDVSEVGLTWTVNLTMMDALRPFTKAEVESFGGATAFVPSVWSSEVVSAVQQRWSIPWTTHGYAICYRRDLLLQANVDVKDAFTTPERIAQTAQRLCDSGVEMPWVLPTGDDFLRDNLHLMASWIWGQEGHFISPDGRSMLLMQPEALAGIKTYFELYRHLPVPVRQLKTFEAHDLFLQGRTAMTVLSIPNLYLYFRHRVREAAPIVYDQLATAVLPGVPYLGGSNLVMWRHVPYSRQAAALKLVRHLTDRRAQQVYGQRAGVPPARLEALQEPFFIGAPFESVWQTAQTGRAYHALQRWGIVEERLTAALAQTRSAVLADPAANLDSIIAQHFAPVVHKLDAILAN